MRPGRPGAADSAAGCAYRLECRRAHSCYRVDRDRSPHDVPGRFVEQFIAEKMDRVSLSFLVDRLEIRRGGVAANISFGLGVLGLRPLLVGAVGQDFGPY